MSVYLTDARTALVAALEADVTLSLKVVKWFTWGPGLRKRFDILPAVCPLVSVVPAEMGQDQVANVTAGIDQDLEIGIATDGQDAAPCEELVAAALDVLVAAARSRLGLADEGLSSVEIVRVLWRAVKDKEDARVRWEATITARIHWMRLTT